MRNYEMVLIIHPDLDETAANEVLEKIKGWITEAGGSIVKQDIWGKKRLAYPIKKQKEGQYVLFNFEVSPSFCIELERNIQFLESVMRFLIKKLN